MGAPRLVYLPNPEVVAGELGFNNNDFLRGLGVQFAFTKEHFDEYVRCADPDTGLEYFIDRYIKVETPDGELIKFEPYSYQLDFIRKANKNRFVIAKLARQAGKTTVVAAILLWYSIFNRRYKIAITANKLMQAIEILDRIKLMLEWVPIWMQQGIRVWRGQRISFENKSMINASATSMSGVRGQSYAIIYMDEVAHIHPNQQRKFYNSVYPAITAGKKTKLFMTSTPNGLEMFYDIWHDSELGKNDFQRVDSHWSAKPGRDDQWAKKELERLGVEGFDQEFNCEFLGSSGTLINGRTLSRLIPATPIEMLGAGISIFEPPVDGHTYIITVDVSRGLGLDYQAFVCTDVTAMPYRVCASYRNNVLPPSLLHEVVYNAAQHYNKALVLVESNDVGLRVAEDLLQVDEYEYVVMTTVKAKYGTRLGAGHAQNSRMGVKTSPQVKKIGCTVLKQLVERDQLIINDKNIIWELSRFSGKNGKYEAEAGSHDDLVMCLVLLAWMTDQKFFKESIETDIRKAFLSSAGDSWDESDLTPFGVVSDGRVETDGELRDVSSGFYDGS